jgi:hypothetical protein
MVPEQLFVTYCAAVELPSVHAGLLSMTLMRTAHGAFHLQATGRPLVEA